MPAPNPLNPSNPQGYKALLTGHSRGLGAAIAETLLARHIPVLALSRRGNPTLATRYGGLLQEVALDLGAPGALEHWLAAPSSLGDFLGDCAEFLLINNAGLLQPLGRADHLDPAAIAHSIAVNVSAPLMLTSAVAHWRQGQSLRVLHVSSGAARQAYAGWNIYCASKAALDHHARSVAQENIPGLRICSLAPGVIDTDMQAEIRSSQEEDFPLKQRFVRLKEDGALNRPEVTARTLVDYLLSAGFGEAVTTDLRDL